MHFSCILVILYMYIKLFPRILGQYAADIWSCLGNLPHFVSLI